MAQRFSNVVHRQLLIAGRVPGLRAFVYAAQAVRYSIKTREALAWSRVFAEYPRWRRSEGLRRSPLKEECAWITYGAGDFLESRVRPGTQVFEYGAGGSTLFFSSRGARVISVEHDGRWVQDVASAVRTRGFVDATLLHVEASLVPAIAQRSPDDPDAYVSSDAECAGRSFRAYAAAIDAYADGAFDVILIDGRARPSCFKHALPKVAPGGVIVLDNAERAHYAYIGRTLDRLGWRRHDFAGAGPFNQHFWRTSAWERPPAGAGGGSR